MMMMKKKKKCREYHAQHGIDPHRTICGQTRLRSAYAFTKCGQGLRCSFMPSTASADCVRKQTKNPDQTTHLRNLISAVLPYSPFPILCVKL